MTRQRLFRKIDQALAEHEVDDVVKQVIADRTLQYLLDYTQQLSEELMSKHLHSESMSVGTVITKLKMLMTDE